MSILVELSHLKQKLQAINIFNYVRGYKQALNNWDLYGFT